MPLADDLRKYRKRLLDLSLRNRLLNFRVSRRFTINVESPLTEVYAQLFDGNGGVPLRHLPEEELLDKPPVPPQRSILTQHVASDLERRCANIRKEAAAVERDSGINHLHLVVGMLKWYEADDSEEAHEAPLLFVPLRIEQKRTAQATSRFGISYDESQVTVNPCLLEKLRQDFSAELPSLEFPEDGDPDVHAIERFLDGVEALLASQSVFSRWEVQRRTVVGFLSFAKLRMWLDLDPDQWPDGSKIDLNPLVRGIFGDGERPPLAELSFLKDEEIEKHAPADALTIVVAADSSQHAAVAAAASGANLVIQGPPGTGKSQTITNIIAALIHAGKNVLFVAEKKAALDVVKHNLEQANLGDFVLELHGAKASKAELYRNLAQRLAYTPPAATQATILRNKWQQTRAQLTRYAHAVRKPAGPEGELFPVLIGKMQRLRSEGIEVPLGLVVEEGSTASYSDRLALLERCEGSVKADIFGDGNPWRAHPADRMAMGFEIDPHLIRLNTALGGILNHRGHILRILRAEVGLTLVDSLKFSPETLQNLYSIPAGVIWELKASLGNPNNQRQLDAAVMRVNQLAALSGGASARISDEERRLLPTDIFEALDQVSAQPFFQNPAQAISLENVYSLILSLGELQVQATQVQSLGLPVGNSIREMEAVRDQLRHFASAPPAFVGDLFAGNFLEGASPVLVEAKTIHAQLVKRCQELSATFNLSGALPSADKVRATRQDLGAHGESFLKRWFSKGYKEAKATALGWLSSPKVYKFPDILAGLDQLEGWLLEVDKFGGDSRFAAYLGKLFCGLNTNWSRLEAMLAWSEPAGKLGLSCETVMALAGKQALPQVKNLEAAISSSLHESAAAYANLEEHGFFVGTPFELYELGKLEAHFRSWSDWLGTWIKPLQGQRVGRSLTLAQLRGALAAWVQVDSEKATLSNDSALADIIGSHWNGYETDWDAIGKTRAWIKYLHDLPLPKVWVDGLLGIEDVELWRQVLAAIDGIYTDSREASEALNSITQQLPTFSPWAMQVEIAQLVVAVDGLLAKTELLSRWGTFCQLRRRGKEQGLGVFFDWMVAGKLNPLHSAKAFRLIEFTRFAQEFVAAHPELREFDHHEHEQCRERFRELDRDLLKLHQAEVALAAASRSVPRGNGTGTIGTYTEDALVRHQSRLQMRHAPVRRLMERAITAVRAYKPCFMMSPLTVAQSLPPGLEPFDAVIMDEASQILPEDALGAIARGKQLIVVGDPKQLPPTNFFKIGSDEEEDEDEQIAMELSESILQSLDSCDSFRHSCGLKWHYRSLHESLIAFSNLEFYDNKLLIFPSQGVAGCGIEYVYVDGGVYDARRNQVEAEAVVEAIARHFFNSAEGKIESLGVVTFNIAQKELIEDLIYQRGVQDPEFREAMEAAGGGDEPFLIRNLENIQGEQRDVIFISCTYGPGIAGGQVAQRFGPVNSAAGPRRLNVMFTRSKKRMAVFTSMRPEQVQAEPGEKTGRGYLRRFLQYAQSGKLEIPPNLADGSVVPDSDFEHAVGEFLRSAGYLVDIQVGVAGFYIDIGLRHPNDPGRFFVGIECDGATYHSSKTARDRDRLREEVLRDRGWKLERVWSTDWFHNRKSAQKRLLEAVAATLAKANGSVNVTVTPPQDATRDGTRKGKDQRELFT